ncbi:uncharacterized protein LOC143185639 [Calliopsis andreniformis]|uniref:uncharacterized protein LOC143185639 n=1 Tax=Calliopsis andreniformis TaxID=337506 RepID=UPI003FCEB355
MLERGKFCSSAAIATALTVSAGNQNTPDGDGVKLALYLPNERYACNPDSLYAVPRTELHETEWIEPDSIDAEVSRFVAGSTTTTTTRNNPKRCCRTSTSSGYSSYSPPLSAGSYSCYASAAPGQGFFRTVPLTMKDQFGGGLAVIHESEAIPRPIWPSALPGPRELCHGDENPEYDALYACCGCGCAYAYSYCDRDCEKPGGASARDVLLELSRTLNSVIEGETVMTPEEILHNISHKVAQGIGVKGGIYEYVYHNSSFLSSKKSLLGDRSGTNRASSRMNPVNSKLYSNMRHFYVHNPAWYTSLCTCEHAHRYLPTSSSSSKGDDQLVKKESLSSPVVLVDDHCPETTPGLTSQNDKTVSGLNVCKCSNRLDYRVQGAQYAYTNRCIGIGAKKTIGMNGGTKQNLNKLVSSEPEYATLECSDGGSSSEGMVVASSKDDWEHRIRGFATGDLDFTLDVSRAERLGRAIARAKRKRQWCRALTAFFGLVFFVLSVVVVSLSVTRGRKIFGSM